MSTYWLWFDEREIPHDNWWELDELHKLMYGIPQLIASTMGWPINISMLLVCKNKATRELPDTFFFWALGQLCLLNLVQLFNHMGAAVMTLLMPYEVYYSIIPIAFGYAACYASDFLRGVIAIHRLTVIVFPCTLLKSPVAIYLMILILDMFLFLIITVFGLLPRGAFIFWSTSLQFIGFHVDSFEYQLPFNVRVVCNYINLFAGAISYSVLVPIVLYRRRKTVSITKGEQGFVLPLFVTFCCSLVCFFYWEICLKFFLPSLPSTPEGAVDHDQQLLVGLCHMLTQVLWMIQCSQEPGVLFIFNKGLRQEMKQVLKCQRNIKNSSNNSNIGKTAKA